MKKWNAAEIVELNIAETAGFWDGVKDFFGQVNWDGQVSNPGAVMDSAFYAAEKAAGVDFNNDGVIGRPSDVVESLS